MSARVQERTMPRKRKKPAPGGSDPWAPSKIRKSLIPDLKVLAAAKGLRLQEYIDELLTAHVEQRADVISQLRALVREQDQEEER